jgi:hypothetical protein
MRAVETAIRNRFRQWWQGQYLARCARIDEAMTEPAIRNRFRQWQGQYMAWRARVYEQKRQRARYSLITMQRTTAIAKWLAGFERRCGGVDVRFLGPELPIDLVDQE